MSRKFHGAILIGIFGTALVGILRGMANWPIAIFSMPHPSSTFLQLDFRGASHLGLLEILFAFLFVDLFDNVGTLVGVCEQGGFIKDGKIPRVGRVLVADAVGTIFGALTGTSTVTSYIESAAGVAAGARTGLSNIAVAALFLLATAYGWSSSPTRRVRRCGPPASRPTDSSESARTGRSPSSPRCRTR